MCLICDDWNKNKNLKQAYHNLFETKEQVGVEHATEIVAMISLNLEYDADNLNGRKIAAIKKFITPEPVPVIDRSQL